MTEIPNVREVGRREAAPVITDARSGTSKEMASRMKRYSITMAFRTACFVSMIFVHGNFRWVLLAGAVVLPYIAVVVANQANQRTKTDKVSRGEPIRLPQLTTGDQGEVISGRIVESETDEDTEDRRVA